MLLFSGNIYLMEIFFEGEQGKGLNAKVKGNIHKLYFNKLKT